MCLRKRRIYNPVKEKNRLSISKINIDIPCGKCKDCRQLRQNDWLVRSYFEFTSKPQDAFFVTLSFDELNVPLWNTIKHMPGDDEDRKVYLKSCFDYQAMPEYLLTCFDHEITSRFVDSLRNSLPEAPFRYMLACDSGSFMSRPHLHGVFLFDKGSMDLLSFMQKVSYYWHYGSQKNIQSIATKYKNPFKALEYVCSYSVKDIDFDKIRRRECLPGRFAPRVNASIGWGAQALDPMEFFSDRLMKQGVMFLDRPVLTRQYLKENSKVFVDIKNDGVLVPFQIPRYYELKLMYNWKWNPDSKREEATLNADGIEFKKLRHNGDYEYYYSSFLLSKNLDVFNYRVWKTFVQYYPSSPYCQYKWQDIINDVSLDLDSFWEYCRIRFHLEYTMPQYSPHGRLIKHSEGPGRLRPLKLYSTQSGFGDWCGIGYYRGASLSDNLDDWYEFFDAEQLDRFVEATFIYDCYKYYESRSKADYTDWQAREDLKAKCRHKIAEDPSLYYHLKYHNFNFSNLNPCSYVSQY